ncbi:hypothetical protein K8S17_05910, partial [bacterium]|nr:hypothetical protein [bacterium]
AAAVLVVAALTAFLGFHPTGRQFLDELRGPPPLPDNAVVALLAFDGSDDDYARGFRQYVAQRLHEIEQFDPSLRIIPVSDVELCKITSPHDAGTVVAANLTIAGSIEATRDSVHVQFDVCETETGRSVRVWNVTEQPANVAALQGIPLRFAVEVLGLDLPARVTRGLAAGGTTVPLAFHAFLRGTGELAYTDTTDTAGTTDATSSIDAAAATDTTAAAAAARAAVLFKEAVELDPAFALAHVGLGQALWWGCEIREDFQSEPTAEASLRRALEIEDRCVPAAIALAQIQIRSGCPDEAAATLRRALEHDPLSLPARRALAQLREDNDQSALAEATYRETAELRGNYWRAHIDLGVFLASQGRYDEAAHEFTTVTEIAPGNPRGFRNLGVMNYCLDRRDDARVMFEAALELSPDYSTYSNLATLYFAEARYADAAAMYEGALDIDDSDYRVWGNLAASCLWIPGAETRVANAYQEAVRRGERRRLLKPHDARLLACLASYYAELDAPHPARELISEACHHAPDDVEVMLQAGHTHEVLGDRELALDWIGKALEHGYSRTAIESTPALRGLCADERYQALTVRAAE